MSFQISSSWRMHKPAMQSLLKGWQYMKCNHSKDDQCAQNVFIPMVALDSFIGIH
jgi:hypothetical protein